MVRIGLKFEDAGGEGSALVGSADYQLSGDEASNNLIAKGQFMSFSA